VLHRCVQAWQTLSTKSIFSRKFVRHSEVLHPRWLLPKIRQGRRCQPGITVLQLRPNESTNDAVAIRECCFKVLGLSKKSFDLLWPFMLLPLPMLLLLLSDQKKLWRHPLLISPRKRILYSANVLPKILSASIVNIFTVVIYN
jgi:hypothetical protein